MTKAIKLIRSYSFWKHPIEWFRDRKRMKLLEALVNYEWEHGLKEEVERGITDSVLYGGAIFKNGKRVDPNNFRPTN